MRVMKTNNAVDVWPDAALKNFIFYIFRMYEFSHSLGHKRTNHPEATPRRCPLLSKSGQKPAKLICPLSATSRHSDRTCLRPTRRPSPLSNLSYDAGCIFGLRQELLVYLCGRSRRSKQIALHVRATQVSHLLQLLRCFDPFGDDP